MAFDGVRQSLFGPRFLARSSGHLFAGSGVGSLSSCHGCVFSLAGILFFEEVAYVLLVLFPSFVVIACCGFMLVLVLLALVGLVLGLYLVARCGVRPVCSRWS